MILTGLRNHINSPLPSILNQRLLASGCEIYPPHGNMALLQSASGKHLLRNPCIDSALNRMWISALLFEIKMAFTLSPAVQR